MKEKLGIFHRTRFRFESNPFFHNINIIIKYNMRVDSVLMFNVRSHALNFRSFSYHFRNYMNYHRRSERVIMGRKESRRLIWIIMHKKPVMVHLACQRLPSESILSSDDTDDSVFNAPANVQNKNIEN